MARPADTGEPRDKSIVFRLDVHESESLDRQRAERGGMTRSNYLRHLIQQDGAKIAKERAALR